MNQLAQTKLRKHTKYNMQRQTKTTKDKQK